MFVGFKYNIVLAVVCMCAAVTFVYYLVHRLRSGDNTYMYCMYTLCYIVYVTYTMQDTPYDTQPM